MGWWTKLRDTAESAAVVAGNYFLPGSSLVTSHLVSDGAQEQLNSNLGKLAMLGSGAYGAYEGNLSNWTGGSGAENVPDTTTGADTANKAKVATDVTGTPPPTNTPVVANTVSQGANTITPPPVNTGPGGVGYTNGTDVGGGFNPGQMSTSPIGADYEQMPGNGMFAGNAVNAPISTAAPGIMESIASGNYGQALSNAGAESWDAIKNNKLATAMVGSSLYDMYAKRQMAKKQDELYNRNRADILGMYAPGSPEELAMQQQMARQDAAAGRNSQYGQRATDYAANVAKFKMNALSNAASAQSGLAAAQMGNQYGGLNSMFNNLAMYSLLNKNTH